MRFECFTVGRIIVERGGVRRLPELVSSARRVMVIHNATSLCGTIAGILQAAGIGCEAVEQKGEPTVQSVTMALDCARAAGCDAVIGAGGGSAMDCAKAVAALLANGGGPLDYMEVVGKGQKITRASVPWIAVPTTAGTGAEATRNAVVGYHEKQFKASIRSELMLARVALLDAELAVGVPRHVTAASGADALCQVIESYTSVNANPICDGMAAEGIALAAKSLRKVYDDGTNVDAREDMAIVALLSGITLSNAGLGAVHGFAAPMGAVYPVPHGVVCAALLPHVMAANVAALRERGTGAALGRYAAVGRLLTGQVLPDDAAAIDAGILWIQELIAYMQIPRLREFGVHESRVEAMVQLAKKASSMRHNPIVLSDEELTKIVQTAL